MTGAKISTALSVGEVARRSGVAVSTVHFYEKKGLIEGWRSNGNQRRYARSVLRRIAVIRIGQQAGLGLVLIKQFLDQLPPDQPVSRNDWTGLMTSWQSMLDDRIARLRQLRERLGGCIGCGCLSLSECPLRNPDDAVASEGPGARFLERNVR